MADQQKYAVWRPSFTQNELEELEGGHGTETTPEALTEPGSDVKFDSEAEAWNSISTGHQRYAIWRPSFRKKKRDKFIGCDGANAELKSVEGRVKSTTKTEGKATNNAGDKTKTSDLKSSTLPGEGKHSNDRDLFIPRLLDDEDEITSGEGEYLDDNSKHSEPIPSLAAYDGDITEERA